MVPISLVSEEGGLLPPPAPCPATPNESPDALPAIIPTSSRACSRANLTSAQSAALAAGIIKKSFVVRQRHVLQHVAVGRASSSLSVRVYSIRLGPWPAGWPERAGRGGAGERSSQPRTEAGRHRVASSPKPTERRATERGRRRKGRAAARRAGRPTRRLEPAFQNHLTSPVGDPTVTQAA